eukprot:TRINITY_DN96077_c0_g1_i1.p1 TRINITY_DN96077_c0_g1~~TRINITY_DN96077_c0_g1_i1.p1  ORF type:complete len:553 (-),score=131.87 TRINITY_DN96077_c0_g1_i1:94-1752(-)
MPGRYPHKEAGPSAATAAEPPNEKSPLKPKEQELSLLQNPSGWLRGLSQSYSWKLLAMVACTSHLLKGFVAGGGDEGLIGKPAEFLLGDMGVAAGRLQTLKAVGIVPFALKPVIALMSDAFPIFGYRKMPYVVVTTVVAFLAVLSVGFGFITTETSLVAALFLAFLQVACVDVLMAAKQSEEVKKKASLGPHFITFTWLGINIGQVLSVVVLGPMIARLGPLAPYRAAAPLVLLVLWPALGNFLGEKPEQSSEDSRGTSVIRQHTVLCLMTLMIGMIALTVVVSTFLLDEEYLVHIALGMAILVLASFSIFIRWEITGPVVFFFLLGLLSFNIDGAMFYFCTDSPEEFAAGPHFSPHFYITGIGAASFVGITAGFATGAEFFQNWSYRRICRVTLLLRALTQFAMVPVLRRWTVAWGMPDSVWMLTVMLLDSMVQAWRWIPKQVMAAHLAPQGVEATTLGLHAGTFNMANILSSYLGSSILRSFDISPTGVLHEGHEFQDIWKAQCVSALAPLLLLALVPVLVPDKLQTQALLEDQKDSATHNSLFRRLLRN